MITVDFPAELETLRPFIDVLASEIAESTIPPIEPDEAFTIAAKGVANWVNSQYQQAVSEKPKTPQIISLVRRLKSENNWPPKPVVIA